MDEICIKEKVQQEINRFKKFSYTVFGQELGTEKSSPKADIKNYAKYVLTNGSKDEKREVLSCLKSRLEIKDKQIALTIKSAQLGAKT